MPESTATLDQLADRARVGPVRERPATTVLGLFEAGARTHPDAPALSWAERRFSYRELDEAAERAARSLRAAGARPGSRIAVCLDRSADLVVGLLAVWKTGGVHLPVDLGYPAERIAFLLADSAADLALTRSDLTSRLPVSAPPAVAIDRDDAVDLPDAGAATASEYAHPGPADPAYLIYTSGSTGLPKGVLTGHRALLNVVLELAAEMPCGPGDRWLAMAAAGFDISMAEFCVPLASGAELVLSTEEQLRDPRALVRLIREREVTRMQAVPSQWRLLLDAGFDAPRMVAMIGGENLGVNLAGELRARLAGLFNGYGPTETTVLSTLWRVPPGATAVSIGAPIANTRLHLLDDEGQPVEDGAVGELCIAGAGVADGYADRPELTAARFVPEPGGPDGSLMYRTGDRCRWRADGLLEFVGRADDQVKLNGRRIELGEVEAALSAMPGVAGVAAAVHERSNGGSVLVAYVVPEAGAAVPDAAALRDFGRTRLPAALVPGLLVALDAFPLTPHGKVDRRALPEPTGPATAAEADAPADPSGEPTGLLAQVCAICREVLDVPQVLPGDDLADLGASSLTLMQIVGRMHTVWGVDVPVDVFFDHDTVGEAAAAIAALRKRN
ncbi:non-ribosomal peptide synthetase [Streptacidiphilus rugosus]|uniref:non-ribosomal peptide synthetase n=1 Tax=Streptacidiphilus rugosus TaxID=405783 RepID=UPI00068A5478|nr:non-ribosomal peptide synthetase [Streptacidiphilus rugosus]